jgi:hypothetical protein
MAVGLKILNGDVVINNAGTLDIVEQNAKCSRDFGKMLITDKEYEGNITSYYRYNPSYGTELNNKRLYIGLSRAAMRDTIIILLNDAISAYMRIQENRTNLDLGEVIRYVNFEVYFDVEDLTSLIIEIKFATAYSNEEINLGQFSQNIV